MNENPEKILEISDWTGVPIESVNVSFKQLKNLLEKGAKKFFSTRAPSRPNSIGLSIVSLIKIEKNLLYIREIDIVDGTPLLDIKPYVERFDYRENSKKGWLDKNIGKLSKAKDDGRFL